jgi:demethylmenaquinone methyltransferase/2-methoxy-6-polyprenyl-1,4-benzoquinol methylase
MTVIPQDYKGSSKRERVEEMFDSIASRYDLLNRVLSAGIDKNWRRRAINELKDIQPERILDIATGTADLALEAMRLRPVEIIGLDISNKMLDIGRHKIMQSGFQGVIRLEQGDSERIPYPDGHFDAITVSFGVRNFENLEKGLREMYRVLKPGGKVVILEFSQPTKFPVKQLYSFYSHTILPFVGQLLSRQRSAYEYLPASVSAFPFGEDFTRILTTCGFEHTKSQPLTFGIASIYTGKK